MDRAAIERYESQARTLHRWIEGLSDADLDAHPVPGTWSVRQVLVHVLDWDLITTHRMRRIAGEERPLVIGYDESRCALVPALHAGDAVTAASLFELNRRWTGAFFRALPLGAEYREGVHSERGIIRLGDGPASAADHVDHHEKFVIAKRAALGKPLREVAATR